MHMPVTTRQGVALLIAFLPVVAAADPKVVRTEVIGPLTGHDAKFAPENLQAPKLRYYGTDLGFTYQHGREIVFLFGDTWATEAYSPIQASTGGKYDDTWGTVDLNEWADPALISPSHIPTIKLARNPGTDEVAAINPGHAMDLSKTPLHGFSNGTDEFGVFTTAKPHGCATNADCGASLSCDTGLGYAGVPFYQQEKDTAACVDGTPGCNPDTLVNAAGKPVPHSGLCVDPKSQGGLSSPAHRLNSVAMNNLIGVRSKSDPRIYENVQSWLTSKFLNASVRTVQRFTVTPAGQLETDYSTAHTGAAQRVFVWGRPGFIGVAANHRPLNLYFAYADLPVGHDVKWQLHYFTGVKDGTPQFSEAESAAVPLDLDSSKPGVQPEEVHDVVNQMSLSWIAPLHKWVMFYGGGSSTIPLPPLTDCGVLQLFAGPDCKQANMEDGAVRMRTADNPWGPWSTAEVVLAGGDINKAAAQYGPGGVLYHSECKQKGCTTPTRSPFYRPNEYGFFYAANIIEQWTKATPDGSVDVLWDVSTWDPYRVALMRTRIAP